MNGKLIKMCLLGYFTFLFFNMILYTSAFDSHSNNSAFGKLKNFLYKNHTKFIEINKLHVSLKQFVELLHNYTPSIKDFFESNFLSIYFFLKKLNTFYR